MSKKIEKEVSEILFRYSFNRAPIPVEKIALKMNLAVMPTDLGPGVSGALIIKDGIATIGVNQSESRVRRRFTVAHELGHFILHNSDNNLFVDKGSQILFRNEGSSYGVLQREKEANAFAAALLMPEGMIKSEIESALNGESVENDEELIGLLSKRFDVSEISMTYRLSNLGLLH